MSDNIIYCLKCPFTDNIHYVGKSTQGLVRPMQHLSESHSEKINDWVKDIAILGYAPIISILESGIKEEELDNKERYWIAKYLAQGENLLNNYLITYASLINKTEIIEPMNESVLKEVSICLKERRKLLGIKQNEVAEKLGVGIRWLRKIEQSDNTIQLNYLESFLYKIGLKLKLEKVK